ncbi:MAG TPA: glycosyltransferase family 2 protein [Bacteroidales bacterium]|nr:glycosyltransferase family 2 protein [Bacteroidales bacterium]
MISFVVIGKNEGPKLSRCLNSILNSISSDHIIEYEIIYVDSCSIDDSIRIVQGFKNVRIIKLLNYHNSAIARNIGVLKSRGKILFFIDGDMEIIPGFLSIILLNGNLIYPFISGDFFNYYYDKSNEIVYKTLMYNNKEILIDYKTGGLFLIERRIWNSVGGMRNEFKRSQDFDLGLRLAQKGIYLHRLPIIAAIHHTISYTHRRRKWLMLFDKSHLWGRCYLYRRNIFNKSTWKLMMKQDYSMLSLIIFLILSLTLNYYYILFAYFMVILLRVSFNKRYDLSTRFENILFYLLRDVMQILGFLFFHPSKIKNITYQEIC